jgi:peroxiredoxin
MHVASVRSVRMRATLCRPHGKNGGFRMNEHIAPALPDWQVSRWFNTEGPLRLADLRGRVVMIHAFQMLCPGCVAHGLPLAARVHERFGGDGVAVIGLHCVFEHHEAMRPEALQAFIHEYRLQFPIGVDRPSPDGSIPLTMAQWRLQGTPSTLLLDREGHLRLHHFGALDDLHLGVAIGRLLAQPHAAAAEPCHQVTDTRGCADGVCATSQ